MFNEVYIMLDAAPDLIDINVFIGRVATGFSSVADGNGTNQHSQTLQCPIPLPMLLAQVPAGPRQHRQRSHNSEGVRPGDTGAPQ